MKLTIKLQDDYGTWLVPNEVLLHILKFVNAADRWNFRLTSTKIYELICSVDKNDRPLKITAEKLDNDEIFDSMVNSQRQFNKLFLDTTRVTSLLHLLRLNVICFKFGLGIVDLSWDSCKLTKAQVITLLNFMPNIESLSVISWRMPKEFFEEPTPSLSLPKLKKLKVKKWTNYNNFGEPTAEFFTNFLPKNAIKELNLQSEPEDFLVTQQAVEKLKLGADSVNPDHLNDMKLSELSLKLRTYKIDDSRSGVSIIKSIIEKQPNLTVLDISKCEGCFDEDDAAFITVCNLKKLKILRINIDDLKSSVFMENFNKLKNLREVQIDSYEHNVSPVLIIIDELSHLEMQQLEKLSIYLTDIAVPLDRIERMGRKFISLKSFTVRCDRPLSLNCYLENMKHLEYLNIDYHYSREFSKLCNSFEAKCESLRHLTLQGFAFGSDDVNGNELTLLKLTDMMPKLEQLELDASLPFNIDFIFKIIEKLKNLKVIKNWSMVQSGEIYKQFDYQAITNLKRVADLLDQFSIELRLRTSTIDVDLISSRDDLCKNYNVSMYQNGNFIILRMNKK